MRTSMYLPVLLAVSLAACANASTASPDALGGDDVQTPDAAEQHIDASGIDGPSIEPVDASDIDAPPLPIDAMPIDAPPPPIDACVPIVTQRLLNPNVDSACTGSLPNRCPSWSELPQDPAYPPIDGALAVGAHTAPNGLWLGGLLGSTDGLYQQLAIPATTTAMSFSGQKWFATEETGGSFDFLRIQIRSTADVVLETLVTWSNVDSNTAWTPFTLPVTGNYAGQTIRVYLQSTTDSTLNTNFFLDTFALDVTACP